MTIYTSCRIMTFVWYGGAMFFLGAGGFGEALVCCVATLIYTAIAVRLKRLGRKGTF